MKSIPLVLALALATLALTACTATVRPPSVEVKPAVSGGHGTFCPPGQAKKGRC